MNQKDKLQTPGLRRAIEEFRKEPKWKRNVMVGAFNKPIDAISTYQEKIKVLTETVKAQLKVLDEAAWVETFIVNGTFEPESIRTMFTCFEGETGASVEQYIAMDVLEWIRMFPDNIIEFIENETVNNLHVFGYEVTKELVVAPCQTESPIFLWGIVTKYCKVIVYAGTADGQKVPLEDPK